MTTQAGPNPLRELLFADLPPVEARRVFAAGGPATAWLVALADAADGRYAPGAMAALASAPAADRETRLHLQGWHLARLAGVDPGAAGPEVQGVVVDMGLDEGLDTLAGYADGSARYLNHSGSAIVWEVPDPEIGALTRGLLASAATIVRLGGPLEGARFGPPPRGHAMLSVLTRAGIHVGAGPIGAISADERGGPVIASATALLQALVARAQQPPSDQG